MTQTTARQDGRPRQECLGPKLYFARRPEPIHTRHLYAVDVHFTSVTQELSPGRIEPSSPHSCPMSIIVIGSLNMDLVVRCSRLPAAGETVPGQGTAQIPGGKGANQATAAALLGAHTSMIGRAGNDAFGSTLLQSLRTAGVDTSLVQTSDKAPTGLALITVENSGQNTIVVEAGANGTLSSDDIRQFAPQISTATLLLLQMEVPLSAVQAAITIARKHNVPVILNPAPVPASATLPEELWKTDWFCPNETEAAALAGIEVNSAATARAAAMKLAHQCSGSVLVTLGSRGVLLATTRDCLHAAPFQIQPVDATAAGDAFVAAFAVSIAAGGKPHDAVRFASAAGAIAASRAGASTSLPNRKDVELLLAQQPAAGQLIPAESLDFWNP